MRRDAIQEARKVAVEFVAQCDKAIEAQDADDNRRNDLYKSLGREGFGPSLSVGPSRESGSLRRKSMDLTRALADMRKPA